MNRLILASILTITVSACSSYTPFLYKHDVVQGNVISEDQINLLQNGLTRTQVRLIMGTPAISDPFHPNQETFLFSFKSGDTNRVYQRSLTIFYDENNTVIRKEQSPLTIQ